MPGEARSQLTNINTELHITSTNFDEPRALDIVRQFATATAIHGRRDDGDKETIWLGGLDTEMVRKMERGLRSAGFTALSNGHRYPADNPRNICNRGLSGRGSQIEVPRTLRQVMRSNDVLRQRFVSAVRESISDGMS